MSEPRLVAVDIGNSSTKIGWAFEPAVENGLPIPRQTRKFATGQHPPDDLTAELGDPRCRWSAASVNREGTRILLSWLTANRPADEITQLTYRDLPIVVRVEQPERVGIDRLAAAVAANVLRVAERPAIVVGAGSAITVNLIAADGAFEGGAILPGFRMSAEALFGADQLPLAVLSPQADAPPALGKNTDAAIRSGLYWGAVGATREIVERIAKQCGEEPQTFVTGGDLRNFAQYLGHDATFVPNLVLSGIAWADLQR